MSKKKKLTKPTEPNKILIGYVEHFDFMDSESKEAFLGHPKEKRVYQVIEDPSLGYLLHIGREHTKNNEFEGILLGKQLVGNHDDKWAFSIALIDKDNFMNYPICEEDAKKIKTWFETNNKELNEVLEKPKAIAVERPDGTIYELPVNPIDDIMQEITKREEKEMAKLNAFSDALNVMRHKDPEFFYSIAELITYLSTTYGEKYEAKGLHMGKEFLLSSDSPDVAIFNSIKYLQRYCTTGFDKSYNTKDLYKAAHYILFELTRRSRNENKEA